jgi:hypothetical protein
MDGQVQAIRRALDAAGFTQTAIMAYSTKFASALYDPFREAGGSALKGDRKSYQMNPMNRREAVREPLLESGRVKIRPDPAIAKIPFDDFRVRTGFGNRHVRIRP